MRNKLSDEIIKCYRYADDCARRARSERDADLRQDFLDLERGWLFLASSYKSTARISALSTELSRRKNSDW